MKVQRGGCVRHNVAGNFVAIYKMVKSYCWVLVVQRRSKVQRSEARGDRGAATGVRGRRARMGATRRPPQLVAFSKCRKFSDLTITDFHRFFAVLI